MRTQIIYEDERFLVIYKPAGLATESARIDQTDVLHELQSYLGHGAGNSWLGLVHRLDQPVEGLLAVARDPKTASMLGTQLRTGQMKKTYHAVVYLPGGEGPQPETETKLTDFIVKEGGRARVVTGRDLEEITASANRKETGRKENGREESGKKRAVLTCKILQRHENTALAEITLETGRFHQIRCQLAAHGMPLLGDQKYGTAKSMEVSRAMGIKNVALCADSLTLVHPGTGKKLRMTITPQNAAFREYHVFDGA